MFNLIYQICTFLISIALFPLFFFSRKGKVNLPQRYGQWSVEIEDCVWIHAASFGEVNALTPIIAKMRERSPGQKILVTTMTANGLAKASEIADYQFLAPFDNVIWIQRALDKVKFKKLIISETEIWPAMISYALNRNVPVFQINARISDYTVGTYKKLKFFLAPLLNKFAKIVVINQESKDRFHQIGVKENLLQVGGYSKYDLKAAIESPAQADDLHKLFFSDGAPVITLGSIRPEEEKVWFPAIAKAYSQGLVFNVIVAPRHQEKFDFFAEKLKEYGLESAKFSTKNGGEKIILLDLMGKLSDVYSFSNLAFIGATLVDIGGHNPLEPACYECAICVGPFYNNVRDIVENLRKENGIIFVNDSEQALELIKRVCNKDQEIIRSGQAAHGFWAANQGASSLIVENIGY